MIGPERHRRRSIRVRGYDYAQAGAYFVTICTQGRACLFGEVVDGVMRLSVAGQTVASAWEALPERFAHVGLDEFIVMPNHLHGVVVFDHPDDVATGGAASSAPTRRPLSDVMRAFKSLSAIAVNRRLGRTGPLWQRNYYEHIVRSDDDWNHIRQYIRDNPAQWDVDREDPP